MNTHLSAENMGNIHLMVVNYGRQVVRREQIRFQKNRICRKRGMRIPKGTEDDVGRRRPVRKTVILPLVSTKFNSFTDVLTFSLMIDFSPARTRRATSSSVRWRQDLSYVAFDPMRASFSRVAVSLSGEQKHRYA